MSHIWILIGISRYHINKLEEVHNNIESGFSIRKIGEVDWFFNKNYGKAAPLYQLNPLWIAPAEKKKISNEITLTGKEKSLEG